MNIQVERIGENKLTSVNWSFYQLSDMSFVLDSYVTYKRETTRHKWVSVLKYKRIGKRDSNIGIELVNLPQDVMTEAREKAIDSIKFSITK